MGHQPQGPPGEDEQLASDATASVQAEFGSLVPTLFLQHPERTGEHSYQGALLFADISGFTSLTEALSSRGPEGCEVLNRLLNAYFSPLISTVEEHGGHLLSLAGDSLTALFHNEVAGGDAACLRAVACALALQRATLAFQEVDTPIGMVSFSIKVAIGDGVVNTAVVGSPIAGQSFISYGDALDRAAALEKRASPGETLISDVVLSAVPGLTTEEVVPGCHRVVGPAALTVLAPIRLPHRATEEDVHPHVPPAVWPYLSRGAGAFLSSIRQVTALFIGFKELAPEAERYEALASWFAQVQDIIDRYRGFLLAFEAGDKGTKLIALFGAPVAVEHAAARALECALDLQEAAAQAPTVTDQRIGIATGALYVGLAGGAGQYRYTALGDRMNLSARLMVYTEPGTILTDKATAERAGDGYRWSPTQTITVKGKQGPVEVCRLNQRASHTTHRPQRRGRGLVGRDLELRRIREHTEAAVAGQGQVLTIVGDAGIGKSRLLEPLVVQASEILDAPVLIGTCADYTQGSAYRPWWPALSYLFGLEPRDPETVEKLSRTVLRLCPEHAERVALLGPLVGVPMELPPLFRALPASERQRLAEEMIIDVILAAHGEKGLILVFDDAHWMDSSSASLLERVARRLRSRPILLAVAMRPPQDAQGRELLETLEGLQHSAMFRLGALKPEHVEVHACNRLNARSLGPDVLHILVERSQCNPLVLEELCDLLAQSGQLVIHRGCARLALTPDQLVVPESVSGLVLARLEHVSPDTRICLQVASVLGRHFNLAQLSAIHPGRATTDDIRAALAEAHRLDILRVERETGGDAYFFKHVLSQEAIYSSLSFEVRRNLHGIIAAHFEAICTPENRRDMVPLIAEHYRRIGDSAKLMEYALEAGELAQERHLNRVAASWYVLDAEQRRAAGEAGAECRALRAAQDALDDLGDLEEQGRVLDRWESVASRLEDEPSLARVLSAKVTWLHRRGRSEEALAAGEAARDLFCGSRDEDSLVDLQLKLSSIHLESRDLDHASLCLEEARAHLTPRQRPTLLIKVLSQEGVLWMVRGDPDRALARLNEALRLCRSVGEPTREVHAVGTIGILHYRLGQHDLAAQHLSEAADLARRLGNLRQEGRHRYNLGCSMVKLGRLSDAREHYLRATMLFERTDYALGELSTLVNLHQLAWLEGTPDRVRGLTMRMRSLESLLIPAGRAEYSWHLAELALCRGNVQDALRRAEQAVNLARESDATSVELEALGVIAEAKMRQGSTTEALASCQLAAELLARPCQPEWPSRFRWRSYQVLSQCGRPEEARASLEAAFEDIRQAQEGLATPEARERVVTAFPWHVCVLNEMRRMCDIKHVSVA